jgi:carboxylesterase type B
VVFAQSPGQAWDGGHGSAVPLLAGWTLDEVATFSRQDIDADIPVRGMFRPEQPKELEGGVDVSADGGLGAVSSWAGGDASGAIAAWRALFPGESDTVLARRLVSDAQFRYPAERAALARDAAGSATYLYRFEWASPVMSPLGAPHAADIAPFLANEQLVTFTRDNNEARALAETMSSALAAFMRTGAPSTDSLTWPRYQADNRAVMILGRESRVLLDPERTVRLAYEKLSPRSAL